MAMITFLSSGKNGSFKPATFRENALSRTGGEEEPLQAAKLK